MEMERMISGMSSEILDEFETDESNWKCLNESEKDMVIALLLKTILGLVEKGNEDSLDQYIKEKFTKAYDIIRHSKS